MSKSSGNEVAKCQSLGKQTTEVAMKYSVKTVPRYNPILKTCSK